MIINTMKVVYICCEEDKQMSLQLNKLIGIEAHTKGPFALYDNDVEIWYRQVTFWPSSVTCFHW